MTHFLDIEGKIADLEAILAEYEDELYKAQRKNDRSEIARLERLIESLQNEIAGLRRSL